MTPEEDFIDKKPNVSHFRIFGSLAYCHILGDTGTKLDQTTERGYPFGYSETSKEYRIFIPRAKRVIIRCDVKFLEDKASRRSRDLLVDDQSEQLVEAIGPSQWQQSTNITFTGTSVGSDGKVSQSMEQHVQ